MSHKGVRLVDDEHTYDLRIAIRCPSGTCGNEYTEKVLARALEKLKHTKGVRWAGVNTGTHESYWEDIK